MKRTTLEQARTLLKMRSCTRDGERPNRMRAYDGGVLVALHNTDENDEETALGDLLADLRHWAVVAGVDWTEADRRSMNHFNEELREERMLQS